MADNAQVMSGIARSEGVRYSVLTPNMKGFESALLSNPDEVDGYSISSSSLTKLAIENLHACTKALFLSSPKITHPGMFFWPNKSGLVGHFLQMHPVYLSKDAVVNAPIAQFNSIDGDFLTLMIPDKNHWDDISILSDPGSIIMYELSASDFKFSLAFNSDNIINESISWLGKVTRPINYWIFKREVSFGGYDLDTDFLKDTRGSFIINLSKLIDHSSFKAIERYLTFTEMTIDEYKKLTADKPVPENLYLELGSSEDLGRFSGNKARVLFTVCVWGESYIRNFLNICLPSMLSDGNLETVCAAHSHLFLVYTEKEDVEKFKSNALFKALLGIINFEFIIITTSNYVNKYDVVNCSQAQSIQRSREYDAIFFLYADFVWSVGSMEFAISKIEAGYDGVISPVPPLILERFYEDLALSSFGETSYFSFE
jgi:hypothetical protein